jgi:hypothetical protein
VLTFVLALLSALSVGCERKYFTPPSAFVTNVATNSPPTLQHPPAVAWPQVKKLPNVPEWAVDAVFYQIFPERFRNGDPKNDPTRDSLEFPETAPASWQISPWTGDWYARADWEKQAGPSFYENGVFNRRYGGDLQGVLNKLDYLADLGVNAIYFNPVFYARSLHKYDGASMHHVDPYFGPDPKGDLATIAAETSDPKSWHWTAADKLFLKLLAEAHARGIRVIIDGVFNHTGRDFFAFADLRKNQSKSPYQDWYIVAHYDNPDTPQKEFQYKGWWGNDTLPEPVQGLVGQRHASRVRQQRRRRRPTPRSKAVCDGHYPPLDGPRRGRQPARRHRRLAARCGRGSAAWLLEGLERPCPQAEPPGVHRGRSVERRPRVPRRRRLLRHDELLRLRLPNEGLPRG